MDKAIRNFNIIVDVEKIEEVQIVIIGYDLRNRRTKCNQEWKRLQACTI